MELKTEKMLAQVEDGIGWVTFNSPERRNAISLEMWEGLATILEAFQHTPLKGESLLFFHWYSNKG